MLPAHRRLTTEFFEKTIAGRSFHSPSVSLKVIMSSEKSPKRTRFAVSASKKNFKTAVSRNSARRRVYAAVASLLSRISDGFFVVILAKPELLKLKRPELESVLGSIFTRSGIMKNEGSKVE